MGAGITFRIGGALDPSFRGALAQSVVEARAAASAANKGAIMMQRSLQNEINAMKKGLIGVNATTDAAGAAIINAPLLAGIRNREEQITHLANQGSLRRIGIAKVEAAAIVATAEAESLAVMEARVAAAAAGKSGVGGHGPAGMTGIIRESLVIVRELSMGRGLGRVAGSVTLLAQYMGLLGHAVKSTATSSLLAAKAARELSVAMDIEAIKAKGTAAYIELESAAKAQNVIATDAEKVATYELVAAKVSLNAVFFIGAGLLVAAAAGAFLLYRHFAYLARTAKNLADALNPLKKKYTELAAEQEKAAKAAKENSDWLADLNNKHELESHAIERKIKLLKEEQAARRRMMEARGASDAELQALDRANLEQEKAMLEVQQKRLETENAVAQAAEAAASKAAIAGVTAVDEKGRAIDLEEARKTASKRGDILEAAQEAMDDPDNHFGNGTFTTSAGGNGAVRVENQRPANESDILDFKVGGKEFRMSVAEAKKNFDFMNNAAKKLAEDQAALDNVLKNAKSTATEKMDAQNRVKEDLENVNSEIGIANTSPNTRREGGHNRTTTERERVGIGAPQVANLQRQHLDVARQQLIAAHGILYEIEAVNLKFDTWLSMVKPQPSFIEKFQRMSDGW